MPIVLIDKDERLTYTPDREGYANFPQVLRDAIMEWQARCDAQQDALRFFLSQLLTTEPPVTPIPDEVVERLHVPAVLLDAVGRMATIDTQDVVYTYKRLPGNVRAAIIHQHTALGLTDVHSARWAMGAAALLDWHNVCDAHGAQVPFDKALIPALPGDHVFQIGILIDAGAPTDFLAGWLGSSNGSSSSPGTTAMAVAHDS